MKKNNINFPPHFYSQKAVYDRLKQMRLILVFLV